MSINLKIKKLICKCQPEKYVKMKQKEILSLMKKKNIGKEWLMNKDLTKINKNSLINYVSQVVFIRKHIKGSPKKFKDPNSVKKMYNFIDPQQVMPKYLLDDIIPLKLLKYFNKNKIKIGCLRKMSKNERIKDDVHKVWKPSIYLTVPSDKDIKIIEKILKVNYQNEILKKVKAFDEKDDDEKIMNIIDKYVMPYRQYYKKNILDKILGIFTKYGDLKLHIIGWF